MAKQSKAADELPALIEERNRILSALDVDAAKKFVLDHGGAAPAKLDWLRVLHLARYEITTITEAERWESRIYLAKTGAKTLTDLHPQSPYLTVAMNLIFPKIITDTYVSELLSDMRDYKEGGT